MYSALHLVQSQCTGECGRPGLRVCVPRLCHGPGGGLQSLAADQGEVSLGDRGQGPERSLQPQVRKLYLSRVIKW